jgi:hypothetical protein
MGRKVSFRCSVRLHHRLLRPFSDSFRRDILGSSACSRRASIPLLGEMTGPEVVHWPRQKNRAPQ